MESNIINGIICLNTTWWRS